MSVSTKTYVQTHMRDALANHVLEEIPAGEQLKCFVMRQYGGGSFFRVEIAFTPAGIAIMGDIDVGTRNGCLSDHRYGLDWFTRELSEDYLCSKFLEKSWQWEACKAELSDWVNVFGYVEDEHVEEFKEMIDGKGWEYGDEPIDSREVYERLSDLSEYYVDGGAPGVDYKPRDAGWLCAIQQRFRELKQ